MKSWLQANVQAWSVRKHGQHDQHRLRANSMLLVPTRFGMAWLLLLLLLWLAAINYQNGLILLMTFVLFAFWLLALHLTNAQLSGLRLQLKAVSPGVLGANHELRLLVTSPKQVLQLQLDWSGQHGAQLQSQSQGLVLSLQANTEQSLSLYCQSSQRGWQSLPLLKVSTQAPWGLFYCAAYLQFESKLLAWPKPVAAEPQALAMGEADEDIGQLGKQQGDEFDSVVAADPMAKQQRILWRRYLRTGELLQARFEQPLAIAHLSWYAYPHLPVEQRLSALCAALLEAKEQGARVGLELPGRQFEADLGQAHYLNLLQALAEYEA